MRHVYKADEKVVCRNSRIPEKPCIYEVLKSCIRKVVYIVKSCDRKVVYTKSRTPARAKSSDGSRASILLWSTLSININNKGDPKSVEKLKE
jgi:hypothetical protein